MKKISVLLLSMLLLFGVVACQKQVTQKEEKPKIQQDTPSQVAYKFLKAYMQSDYEEEQKYLYEKGSYEIDKNREKQSIAFSSKNIEGVKEYRDKANQVVYVWIKYDNPHTNDITTDVYAIRKNENGDYKVDIDADINFPFIQQKIEPKVIDPKSLGV